MTRLRVVRLIGAALVAASTVLAFSATTAGATKDKPAPTTDDSRALASPGNARDCADIGIDDATYFAKGEKLEGLGYAVQGNGGTTVTLNRLPDGVTLTAIVVKGGDAYNLYNPGERGLGESLPYENLRSPLVGQGNVPTISHWFVCGTQTAPVTCEDGSTPGDDGSCDNGTPPTCEDGSKPADDGSCKTPAATPATTPAGAVDAATPAVSGSNAKDLAQTGFNPALPTGLAVVLLLVGGLMVITPGRAVAMVSRLRRR